MDGKDLLQKVEKLSSQWVIMYLIYINLGQMWHHVAELPLELVVDSHSSTIGPSRLAISEISLDLISALFAQNFWFCGEKAEISTLLL